MQVQRISWIVLVCLAGLSTVRTCFSQETLSEKQFVEAAVEVKDADRIGKMEDRLFRVTGYCWFEKEGDKYTLFIKPVSKMAKVIVESTPPCCYGTNLEQEVSRRQGVPGNGNGRKVKITIQAYAKTHLEELKIERYNPMLLNVIDTASEKELQEHRMADAIVKGKAKTKSVVRLWKFYDAKPVLTIQQARKLGLVN